MNIRSTYSAKKNAVFWVLLTISKGHNFCPQEKHLLKLQMKVESWSNSAIDLKMNYIKQQALYVSFELVISLPISDFPP